MNLKPQVFWFMLSALGFSILVEICLFYGMRRQHIQNNKPRSAPKPSSSTKKYSSTDHVRLYKKNYFSRSRSNSKESLNKSRKSRSRT